MKMCGEMGKAVLRALTGALLCGLVSDAAYLQRWPNQYEDVRPFHQQEPNYQRHGHTAGYNSAFHTSKLRANQYEDLQPQANFQGHGHTIGYNSAFHTSKLHDKQYEDLQPEPNYQGHLHTTGYNSAFHTSKLHTKKPEFLVLMDKHFFGKLNDDTPQHIPSFATSNRYLKKRTPFEYERSPYLTYKYPEQHSNYPSHYDEPYINFNHKPLREHEKPQDLRNVPGSPGIDYPIYHEVPETGFSCSHVPVHPGMYANVETGCQAYHVCHDGREGHQGASFLCTNGTLFDQAKFACDWWYNVDCSQAIAHYKLNADPLKNPYVPKPKPEDEEYHQGAYYKRL